MALIFAAAVDVSMSLATGTAWAVAANVSDKGVGPIKEVKLGHIDPALAKKGHEMFEQTCAACHRLDQRFVGPPLRDVTKRRAPEWIMNMILNPSGMLHSDPAAKQLLAEYHTPMSVAGLNEADARALLEYLREAAARKADEEH